MVHHAWEARNEVGWAFLRVCREQLRQGKEDFPFLISQFSFFIAGANGRDKVFR